MCYGLYMLLATLTGIIGSFSHFCEKIGGIYYSPEMHPPLSDKGEFLLLPTTPSVCTVAKDFTEDSSQILVFARYFLVF